MGRVLLKSLPTNHLSYLNHSECTAAEVGSSSRQEKSISIDYTFQCPPKVDRTNWLSRDTYGDTFSVTQTGNIVTVTRTDANRGWGMNLRFKCCRTIGKFLVWSENTIKSEAFEG